MRIEKLSLVNFRNHRMFNVDFDLSTGSRLTTVIVGNNSSGKTNILEAINLLATGGSFREGKVEEMVNFGSEVGHVAARVRQEERILRLSGDSHIAREAQDDKLDLKSLSSMSNKDGNGGDVVELQVAVTRGVVQGRRVAGRRLMVNGVGRSREKFVGNLAVVVFRPEDMRIMEGSPTRRRRFLDEVLSQSDREYVRSLTAYNKTLVRRNKLLEMIREKQTQRTSLAFWDQLLLRHGEYVQKKRRELVDTFNNFQFLVLGSQSFFDGLKIEYDISIMSPVRLAEYADREVYAGHTLVGPHRDDFSISTNNPNKNRGQLRAWPSYAKDTADKHLARSAQVIDSETQTRSDGKLDLKSLSGLSNVYRDLAVYGSRGEQRLGVLWLKTQSLAFLRGALGEEPVLLLDDIWSELDHEHRKLVFGLLGRQQTIATTADKHFVEGLSNVQFIYLNK